MNKFGYVTLNILFIHQNFPGQFKHLAPALKEQGYNVTALSMKEFRGNEWNGIPVKLHKPTRSSSKIIHPWVGDFETKIIRAESAYRSMLAMKQDGYTPDIVIAHPGWGEAIFVKEVWPETKLGIYCEFFYKSEGADTGFDPEFPIINKENTRARLFVKNAYNFMNFHVADGAVSPTEWQASTFPLEFRSKIKNSYQATVDIAPTIAKYLGVEIPYYCDGDPIDF